MSKLFIDLYYFVKSSFLEIETEKRWCLIYTCDTNWYEPQLEVHAPAWNKGHEEASNYIPFECKVFLRLFFLGQKPS